MYTLIPECKMRWVATETLTWVNLHSFFGRFYHNMAEQKWHGLTQMLLGCESERQ